ncbi:MAG: DUF4214 domain-containing protein [Reyranellaceae bacterium]
MATTITYQSIANSTYLDFAGYRVTSAPTVQSAYNIGDGEVLPSTVTGINVALVLPRETDATGLLAQDWATRQETIQDLNSAGTLWETYGANIAQYNTITGALQSNGLQVLNSSNSNYVSSWESRTIWVNIASAADFQTLFNTELMYSPTKNLIYWNGSLSLPSTWNVTGLWFDYATRPPATDLATGGPVTLTLGAQGIGNSTSGGPIGKFPQEIAQLYNFPLDGQQVTATGTIGLIEPGIGSALPDNNPNTDTQQFQALLTTYLETAYDTTVNPGAGLVYVQGTNGQQYSGFGGERALDTGVVAAVNPNSDIYLYNGSGYIGAARASDYTASQSAIWDTVTIPIGNTSSQAVVTSSSYDDFNSMSPDSPFYRAYRELFTDAALANQTTVLALGDGGSGGLLGNGLTNVQNQTSPWNILVGGTSLSTTKAAINDTTVGTIVQSAMAGNLATIWQLVSGGLTSLPADAAASQGFVSTVWNTYYVDDSSGELVIEGIPLSGFSGGYITNSTGAGGVDVTQPVPSYQVNFGLTPTTSDSQHLVGRGVPDVSADAGGNLVYKAPPGTMVGMDDWEGTSAASPLWASLILQIDTVFQDQNLPNLGYMNDLLYIAAKVAPASFNDISLGNNTSSFFTPGAYTTAVGTSTVDVSPTGYGYNATPGYDLVSGLGSPNGLLLARALTTIAHTQMDDLAPPVFTSYGAGGWANSTVQSLLVQIVSPSAVTVGVTEGSTTFNLASKGTAPYAWTDRLAGQSEQSTFDPNLVRVLDKAAQGTVSEVDFNQVNTTTNQYAPVAVSINGVSAQATTAALTNPFGFVDFQTADGMVRLARPVAVAQTVDSLDNQIAVVNLRQDTTHKLSVAFYQVDSYTGTVGTLNPGDPNYASTALAQPYAYKTTTGATTIAGPGNGQFAQVQLAGIGAGDIVAMAVTDSTLGKTYWAFSAANDLVDGQHPTALWNYGLNTWGWDTDGDHDFNDLVVNLDFTSAYGQGYLVSGPDNSPTVPTAAWNDAYVVLQNQALEIDALNGLLINDAAATTATLVTGPAHGSLQLGGDGSVSYTPVSGFVGVDSFSYQATGAGQSANAQVSVYVVPTQGTTSPTLNLLALNAQEQVTATYTAFFGRGADLAGFQFWVNQFNAGSGQSPSTLFADIANAFGTSSEAKALYPFLANPKGASDGQISDFLDAVYNNLFARSSDSAGLTYWTAQIKQALTAGQFVGSVLVNIVSGAQAGHDAEALMGKVAVGLEFVNQQQAQQMPWNDAVNNATATMLLHGVTNDPHSILMGIKEADQLVAVST